MPRESRLRVGGHSAHVAPRTSNEGERPSAGAVPFHSVLVDRSQRGTARARSRLARIATFGETASAVARARVCATQKPAVCWRPQLAHRTMAVHRRREAFHRCSDLPWHVGRSQSARYSARAQRARVIYRFPKDSQRSGACSHAARMPASCWSQLACRTTAIHRKMEASHRCSARPWCVGRLQPARHGARAATLRISPPPKRQPPQWRSFACHTNADCALEVTARTSRHGLASIGRCLSPVQCPFIVRKSIATSATRRARTASLRVLPPPDRQPAQWHLRACHVNAGCALEATARASHHGHEPKERGLPPVQCPPVLRRWITTSVARRVRGKLACFATSR